MISPITSNLGWTCPKCGYCYAPTMPECSNCNRPENEKYKYSTNSSAEITFNSGLRCTTYGHVFADGSSQCVCGQQSMINKCVTK